MSVDNPGTLKKKEEKKKKKKLERRLKKMT